MVPRQLWKESITRRNLVPSNRQTHTPCTGRQPGPYQPGHHVWDAPMSMMLPDGKNEAQIPLGEVLQH